ncbi:MAG: hypothetical protein M1503_06440 [Thaumarchaeota archaeon]|nr:hypothetical protein [Nitrososphaerota archaeon]MCL5317881.1 hypothetical protein [Nitrososphaerota archaeon]
MFSWTGKILRIDLTSQKITEVSSSQYFPKFIGGRGLIAKVIWDEVPVDARAFDPENRLIFAPGALAGTNSPSSGRWRIGSLAPQHPKEYPSHSGIGGHWAPELKFAGYDGVIVHGKASKPVYILIRDEEVEIRSAGNLWGMEALEVQKRIQQELTNDGGNASGGAGSNPRFRTAGKDVNLPDTKEWRYAARYDPRHVRCVAIGPAGEKLSRVATIMHDSGDAAGQCGFGGVMGSKNLKAIAVRGTGSVPVAKPKELVETVFKIRKLIRVKAMPVVPAYGGPGGIYGGNPKILTSHMKRLDGCFGCQVICRAYIAPPGMTPGHQQCVALQMYYNWEGVGPVAPLHKDFAERPQDETAWYGVKLADRMGINSYELTGILSWLWAAYKEGILTEQNTGVPIQDMGSIEFADKLFGMLARREGEFGNLLADGVHRTAEKLREKYGNRIWELYEERYTAHGSRQHWFYIGTAKGPGDPTGYPNPVGQILWATDTRDPYSNHSWTRVPYGDQEMCKWFYGTAAAANPFTYEGKPQAAVVAQHHAVLIDSVGLCDWFFPTALMKLDTFFTENKKPDDPEMESGPKRLELEAKLYSQATGIDTTMKDLLKISEGVFNLERANQVRRGRRREDDTFNEYYFTHKDRRGNAIDRPAWEKAKDEYYQMRGWDQKTGIPTKEKLNELGLTDVANELYQYIPQEHIHG